jgi:hypothetical protein
VRKRNAVAAAVAAVAVAGAGTAALADIAPIDAYADSLVPQYETAKVISAGDTVPESSDPSKDYRIVGIPDGLGAHRGPNGTRIVYMNHELGSSVQSEPVAGEPLNRGAFVSRLVLSHEGKVLSGERAYDTVYIDDTLVGPAPEVGNSTRAFSRFCSGSLAGPAEGFDRPIYFANEEEGTPANTFDGKGGLSVAIFDHEAHALTDLGRFAWENTLVQPGSGKRTVIMGMEDGPAALDRAVENSQLYMYVGEKDRSPGATVLERNGLVGGKLYVFAARNAAIAGEAQFHEGTITGKWVEIPGADQMDEAQLESASDAAGAMAFARPEDGAFNSRDRNEYLWVTTGGAAGVNELGRIYSLDLDAKDPAKAPKLTVEVNADAIVAEDGDISISPDNVDVSSRYLMVQEDGTTESRAVMAAKGRDGSIWRYELDGSSGIDVDSATRVVTLAPPGRDGAAVGPGVWETSGIIDGDGLFGGGSWLFDVQAHSPTAAPAPNTVEDGQLLLLTRK